MFMYIWAPIIVAILIGIGKFIINDKLLYVKEIKVPTDNDIDFFIELYNKRIDEKYRICAEEILSFVGKNGNNAIQHHLYVCKKWDKIVGFIKFMVSIPEKYIFIAYVAIDNKDRVARRYGLKALLKIVLKKYFLASKFNQIIMEIEKGQNGTYHSAFSRLIARYASDYNRKVYIYDFDYVQPNMPDDEYNIVREEKMSLVIVPYYMPSHKTISKGEVIDLVRTIYFDIYCPSCNGITNCCEIDYSRYLNRLIGRYNDQLSEEIELIDIEKI